MDEELKKLLVDRFDAWEIVEFLQISTEDVIDAFSEEILENIDDVLEFAGLRREEEEND